MTHVRTHARTHAHGANYNLPPASRAGDNMILCDWLFTMYRLHRGKSDTDSFICNLNGSNVDL